MTEPLSFEAKIEGLRKVHQELNALDPRNTQFADAVNPAIFNGSEGRLFGMQLTDAKDTLRSSVASHARQEYAARLFAAKDLRADTAIQRAERLHILALTTAPMERKVLEQRSAHIGAFLGKLLSGEPVQMSEFASVPFSEPKDEVRLETDRPVFGVFPDVLVARPTFSIQYDTPEVASSVRAVGVSLDELFAKRR